MRPWALMMSLRAFLGLPSGGQMSRLPDCESVRPLGFMESQRSPDPYRALGSSRAEPGRRVCGTVRGGGEGLALDGDRWGRIAVGWPGMLASEVLTTPRWRVRYRVYR